MLHTLDVHGRNIPELSIGRNISMAASVKTSVVGVSRGSAAVSGQYRMPEISLQISPDAELKLFAGCLLQEGGD